MKSQYFVGLKETRRQVFKSAVIPTRASHGNEFNAVVGPFRTKRAATFFAAFGNNNPHVRCVADAERIARNVN